MPVDNYIVSLSRCLFVNRPFGSACGMEKIWNVFLHNLIARRFSMPKFRWPELKYDIVMAREVSFSCPSTRLKRRLGWEGKEAKKKVHILVFVAIGLNVVHPNIQEMLEFTLFIYLRAASIFYTFSSTRQ